MTLEQEYYHKVCERDADWSMYCKCPTDETWNLYVESCEAVKKVVKLLGKEPD